MVQDNALALGIGEQVRRRREQRGMTAAELARRSGLSKATLSSLEAGRANPTIDTLDSVAQTLGVPLADILVAPAAAPTILIRNADLDEEQPSDEPIRRQLLHRVSGGHQVESWRLRMLPGAEFDGVPHADGTQEQLILSGGSLRAGHIDDQRDLAPGDSLVFDGTTAHRYIAGADGADVVVILTSPATT